MFAGLDWPGKRVVACDVNANAGDAMGIGGMPPIIIACAPYVLVSFSKACLIFE